MQEDPIKGFIFFSQSLNLYPYCDNNPINWIDPWGLFAIEYPIPGIGILSTIYVGGGTTIPGNWVPIDRPIPGDLAPPVHIPDPERIIKVKKEQKKEGITDVINNWTKKGLIRRIRPRPRPAPPKPQPKLGPKKGGGKHRWFPEPLPPDCPGGPDFDPGLPCPDPGITPGT